MTAARTPPVGVVERWQPELDRIAPRTARGHSHLRLMWEPGEDWEPVERWVVWEMMHPSQAHRLGIWQDLEGPPPRRFGRYDRARAEFVRTRNFSINQRQWDVHHETGLFGRPVWVVQGTRGGHKRHWNDVEQNLMAIHLGEDRAGDVEPPAMGELCYAEPDRRTIDALRAIDLVHLYGDLLRVVSNDQHLLGGLDRRERDAARTMADQLWAWLEPQVEETLQFTRKMQNALWAQADPDAPEPDYEQAEETMKTEIAEAAGF